MPSFSVAKSTNASFSPSYVPIAVITGATSGIGAAIARALATHLHGRIHLVLVGRNKAAADALIASLPAPPSSARHAQYEFVACDLTLMANAHALARDLAARLPKINFLVHCAGVFGLLGRVETEEGIDVKLATRYYARFALTHGLLKPLQQAASVHQPASVLSVLGAGLGAKIDMQDLGMKNNYSGVRAMTQSICYNDLMVAGFAERYPEVSFTHIYPGAVDTGMFIFSNPILRALKFLLQPLLDLMLVEPHICAEYMLYALLDANKGMNRRNQTGDDIGRTGFPDVSEEARKVFWEHCLKDTLTEE
ncbi:hypothetical protein D9619_008023 [Psilocybe cf. subviscida]|uniref:NAD(P)-binding protein n=1 Tax=Psilocybe cf. subviscida TaxID=2480587 RepID=A0A8H5ESI5_9AGAR|nr:hypothetical protein D9619_008023 [Psilocybe cf. subviscida]